MVILMMVEAVRETVESWTHSFSSVYGLCFPGVFPLLPRLLFSLFELSDSPMRDKLSFKGASNSGNSQSFSSPMVSIIPLKSVHALFRTSILLQDGFLHALSNLLEHMVLVATLEGVDCELFSPLEKQSLLVIPPCSSAPGTRTRFHGISPPSISIYHYLQRVESHFRVGLPLLPLHILVSAVLFRMLCYRPHLHGSTPQDPRT